MSPTQRDYLRRLPARHYQGRAFMHWSMTIEKRKTGWLTSSLHEKLREILVHATFRYGMCCPLYCCMPDHIHMLWVGIRERCDQRNAARFVREQLNIQLVRLGVELQKQAYDHVLGDEDRQETTFATVAEYIARDPERAQLVPEGSFRDYPYTGCLVPGYPALSPWQDGFWDLFWRLYVRLRESDLFANEPVQAGN
ncbi:MAG TPA: hypothetical protein VIK18_18745 [Pirellulales bacterium]